MEEIRRVPVALTLALAIHALLAVALLVPLTERHGDSFEVVLIAARLVAAGLTPVGLFQLAARTERNIRTGAIIAGVASIGSVAFIFASELVRRGDFVEWASFVISAASAIGYAWMIARRSIYVAVAELVVVIAGPWALTYQPIQLHAIRGLAIVAVELVIAATVSPALVIAATSSPRRTDPARNLAIAAAAIYALSLFLPAIRMMGFQLNGSKPETESGVVCLLYGWILFPGWIANPLLLLGAILLAVRRARAALVFGVLAICSAVAAAFIVYDRKLGMESIQIGYWLWLGSIVTFTLAAYARRRDQLARRLDLGDGGVELGLR